jgi:hypothetical protein
MTWSWEKQIAIGTWILVGIGVPGLAVGILSYVRPADPAHPMSLDFLSKAIQMPPWLVVIGALSVSGATGLIVRRKIYQTLPMAPLSTNSAFVAENDSLKKQNADLHSQNVRLRSEVERLRKQPIKRAELLYGTTPPPAISPELAGIMDRMLYEEICSFESPDNYAVHILKHDEAATRGVMAKFTNDSLKVIPGYTITFRSARSYDSRLGDYRDGKTFTAYAFSSQEVIHAGESGTPQWIIRKIDKMPHLYVGTDKDHPAIWPKNDQSILQKWLLSVHTVALTEVGPNSRQGLAPIPLELIIVWDPAKNEFSIEQS